MLDRDLADLYGVQPIRLREQVKRNRGRFPANFMFQLTEEEVEIMVSQNAIPSRKQLGGYLPYAFTEHGITLSSYSTHPRSQDPGSASEDQVKKNNRTNGAHSYNL